MAAATDVVSLDRAKTELRLGGDTIESRAQFTAQDALLTGHIHAAVAFVERQTSRVIVDRDDTFYMRRPLPDFPMTIKASDAHAVVAIRYWTPESGALRSDPDGVVSLGTLGRYGPTYGGNLFDIWPPSDGWPEVLDRSVFEVILTRGMAVDEIPEPWKAAVVLCVRQLYDGYRDIRPTEAFFAMIGNTYG